MAKRDTKDAHHGATGNAAVRWYKPADLAVLLGVTETQLQAWRVLRKGPPFIKLGPAMQSPVVYPEPGVIEWQNQHQPVETERPDEVAKAS